MYYGLKVRSYGTEENLELDRTLTGGNRYYHGATFLQNFTISFLLFPHPYIASELPVSERNDSKSKSIFLFRKYLPIIRCNSLP